MFNAANMVQDKAKMELPPIWEIDRPLDAGLISYLHLKQGTVGILFLKRGQVMISAFLYRQIAGGGRGGGEEVVQKHVKEISYLYRSFGYFLYFQMSSEPLLTLYGHKARVWDCLILKKHIVSIGEDSTCLLWNSDGDIIRSWKGHIGKYLFVFEDFEQGLNVVSVLSQATELHIP